MNRVTEVLDDIVVILERDDKTVADLARELGRNYWQVYDWIKRRQFNPQAGALVQLMEWRRKNR